MGNYSDESRLYEVKSVTVRKTRGFVYNGKAMEGGIMASLELWTPSSQKNLGGRAIKIRGKFVGNVAMLQEADVQPYSEYYALSDKPELDRWGRETYKPSPLKDKDKPCPEEDMYMYGAFLTVPLPGTEPYVVGSRNSDGKFVATLDKQQHPVLRTTTTVFVWCDPETDLNYPGWDPDTLVANRIGRQYIPYSEYEGAKKPKPAGPAPLTGGEVVKDSLATDGSEAPGEDAAV